MGLDFQYEDRSEAERLAEVLNGHGNVIRVFCGHAHRLLFDEIGNIPASTLPSVAVDLRFGEYPLQLAQSPLYQLHKYTAKSGFTTETRAG
jgi:hypothetical protein